MKKLRANTNQETVKWVWAVSEQLYLLDSFDANFIDQASSRWKDEGTYSEFLRKYSLTRGKHGKFLRENAHDVIRICHAHYTKELPDTDYCDTTTSRWHTVVDELAAHQKNVAGSELYSFAMKMYWFYHPDKLPMYDQYVRNSLSVHFDEKITPHNFLIRFFDFSQEKALKIDEALSYATRDYPYRYRIADKYLWLIRPNKDKGYVDRTIKTFISSHKKAAVRGDTV